MGGLLGTLNRFGIGKLVVLGAITAGLIGFFVFFGQRLTAPPMGLLFSELSAQDAGQIATRLEAQGVPFELRAGGSQIFVPADRTLRLRMGLAEQGLPRGGSVGYELFDRSDIIGATNFVQNLNQVRALEGELSRTIGALGPVAAARVHLVVPRRELFQRERQEPTASVVLRLREAGRLPRGQILAVQHLVAAAVPGLKPSRVSIVDDRGTLLARGLADDNDAGALAATAEEMRRNQEQRLARTLEDMLERVLGPGKARAEITMDMDFDRIVTNSETFDPEGQVVRSTQNVTEQADATETQQSGAATVGANLPDGDANTAAGRNNSRNARTEETVNFEISRVQRNHIREAGVVRRMSVAVIIDGSTSVAPDGQRTYTPRSAEEIERLTTLVRGAVGYSQQRGDVIEVVNLPFAAADLPAPVAESSLIDLDKQDYFRIAEIVVLMLVALLVILLVARPLVAGLLKAPEPAAAGVGGGPAQLTDQSGGPQRALAGPQSGQAALAAGDDESTGEAASNDPMIDINRVEGRVKASSLKKISEIVEKHPDEAVAIVRNWMYQET